MEFLIGVIILITFIIFCYFFVKRKIKNILKHTAFAGLNIKEIIKEAKIEEEDTPKSLSSMDRIYLDQIKKDFPDLNINELKRKAEKVLLDCIEKAQEKKTNDLQGKMKTFTETLIHDYIEKKKTFEEVKIHNTVVSNYKKKDGISTIYFGISFQYYLTENEKRTKVQDRVKIEFIYVYDTEKVKDTEKKTLGIHCPNCGSPITSLGEQNCSYCGSAIIKVISKVFTCNDIVRY